MRKFFVLAAAFVSIASAVNAQCDSKTKFTASKADFIKSNGDTEIRQQTVVVIADKQHVDVVIAGGEDELKGDVTDYVCSFTDANNSTINFKSEVTDKGGDVRHASFTIETKDGKTTILLEAKEEETRIRLSVDSSEPVK
jgi:hypothetical protein